jgi:signal transduction histidine kinase
MRASAGASGAATTPPGRVRRTAAAPPRESDERLTAASRLAIAAAGLAVYCVDPSDDEARRPFAYATLVLFLLYSAVSYRQVVRDRRRLPAHVAPWLDVAWTTLLVAVSDGTSSIFYPLYTFAILCASFRAGARAGRAVVIASVLSFSVVGGLTAPRGARFELDQSLIRPLYLLILGYLVAYWGEYQFRQRARLDLLRAVTSLANPRFGVERTVAQVLARVRAFHAAESCRLVVADVAAGETWTRVVTRATPEASAPTRVPAPLAQVLLAVPATSALLLRRRRWPAAPVCALRTLDLASGAWATLPVAAGAALAAAVDAESLVSVPFRYHGDAVGRLLVTSRRREAFDQQDVDFLVHLLDQVAPVLANVRLVDRLATDAADEERRRIARDLHDSIIQPYVGLRLGVSAARQAIEAGRVGEAERHLDHLSSLAESEIVALRAHVRELKDGDRAVRGDLLPSAVRRFCDRFSFATGIAVRVEADAAAADLNDRLAAEAFQMVTEALSNVRRHTDADEATVRIAAGDGRLRLEIENDGGSGEAQPAFSPRSLGERAAALGGTLRVERASRTTALRIEIPL